MKSAWLSPFRNFSGREVVFIDFGLIAWKRNGFRLIYSGICIRKVLGFIGMGTRAISCYEIIFEKKKINGDTG